MQVTTNERIKTKPYDVHVFDLLDTQFNKYNF